LVGLELRPRKLREAALIWRRLTDVRGVAGRDAVWGHPDLLPTDEDFDDPEGFVQGRQEWDMSALDEATGEESPGDGPAGGAEPGDGAEPGGGAEPGDGPAEGETPG
jgi:hypothetical protein